MCGICGARTTPIRSQRARLSSVGKTPSFSFCQVDIITVFYIYDVFFFADVVYILKDDRDHIYELLQIFVGLTSWLRGDYYRTIYGVDSWGNTCNRNNKKFANVSLSGLNLVGKK